MKFLRRLLRPVPASIFAMVFGFAAYAGSVALLTGPLEPSQTLATLNGLINTMNTAYGTTGGGNLSDSIYTPTVTSPVNLLSVTAGATGVQPQLAPGGSASDTNIGLILTSKGTGLVHIGGSTIANGSLRVPTVASAVNQVTVSGAITTAEPTIAPGGSTSDTNIGISLSGKGTGAACLGGTTCANSSLTAVTTASAVTHATVTGGTTGVAPAIAAAGETNLDLQLSPAGTGQVNLGNTTTCSGTTTATCSAQRFIVSVTGLTTAAGASAATMTVTNTKVAATDIVICSVNIYAGTGIPIPTIVTPGTGSVAFNILNVATSGSLNATGTVACVVL